MLHINDLVHRIGARVLFDGATVHIPAGRRVGLVGRNGAGKSTLLKLIVGERGADGGSISIQPSARVGTVAQEAPDGETTPLDWVLKAVPERAALLAEAETATDPTRIAEVHTRLADIGAHAAPAKAGSLLAGLGFDADMQARPLGSFSGGWRMRVALAAALVAEPDLLLLDEPTNHLDLEASLWLEQFLARYPHTLLVVSHDRTLLNGAVDHILHLEKQRLYLYGGGYDTFERTRSEALVRQAKMQARQEVERQRIQSFVDRFRAKATKAKQAQSRLKMLEKMTPIAAVVEEQAVGFSFPKPDILPPPLLTIDDGRLGYAEEAPVLRDLDLRLDADDRIALLGANGNGKSTLAKYLAGRLKPLAGKHRRAAKLSVGYFAQDRVEDLDPALTVLDQLGKLMADVPDQKVRAHLGRFGFTPQHMEQKTANLSGGEKARLAFALICRSQPHLLVLDEPTNHLDVDARQALIQAINDFDGAVVLISHDPHLVGATADRLWLVEGGTVAPYDGTVEEYRAGLWDKARGRRSGGETAPKADEKRSKRQAAAARRAELAPLRKKVSDAEKRMGAAERQIADLDLRLADPDLYRSAPAQAAQLAQDKAAAQGVLATAEADWLDAAQALEAAENVSYFVETSGKMRTD